MKTTIVILPALNEELAIGKTIKDVKEHLPDSEIIVVDNFSEDKTAEIAKDLGATVFSVKEKGKGAAVIAVLKAIKKAHNTDTNYIMIDSDYTYPAVHLRNVLIRLNNGSDVVMGYRSTREKGAMTFTNLVGNKLLSLLASILYSYRVKDVCTGMWGFRASAVNKFNLVSEGFTLEADLFANTIKNKCRIKQIPIYYRARPDGSKAKLKIKDGFKIGWFLLKARL